MRAVLAVIMVLSALVAIANASTERIVLSTENLNVAPIQKLEVTRSAVALGFRLAGIETESVSVGTQSYQRITPLSSDSARFGQTGEEGLPELPVFSQLVGIPDQAGVRLEILSSSFQIIDNYDVMPSQPSEEAGSSTPPPFAKDAAFYGRDEFYPSDVVSLGEPIVCRDLRMIQTIINPVQYNPARRQLKVYTSIDYRLVYEGTDSRNQKIRHNNNISETFLPIYRQMVPNADEMLADYQPIRGGYLIITPNAFADTMKVLARWKHLKGYSTVIARASDINSSGNPTSQQVFNYIQDAYNTWENPPEFVCIVGDIDDGIPDYPYSDSHGTYTSDHQYSCVDGSDYFSDVMVTRMSASDIPTLRVTMRKAIKYESDPYMGDPAYWTRGLSVASREVATTRLTTLWVREKLLRNGFSRVDTAYDNANVLPGYFNNGVSIVSYRGAGNSQGWYGPNPYFLVGDLDGLTGNNKMGVMCSIVCGTGNYGADECFGEKWIRMGTWPNGLKGGPGFYGITDGDTHTKWNNPIMIGYYIAILDQGIYELSTAAFMGKIELYNTYPRHNGIDGYVEHYFYCDNTLGDPEVEIRTAIPKYMVVTYPPTLPVGTSLITVHVADSLGAPLSNAYVNLVKGYAPSEEVFVGGRTNSSGDVTLGFNTSVADTMFVTVTARDYIPHKGFALIQAQPVAVNVDGITLDDDNNGNSIGNGDGNANPNETVELAVSLKNFGNSTTATGINAIMTSTDPRATVTIPSQSYPDLAPGAAGNSVGEFAVHLTPDIPEGEHIILQLGIASNEGSWSAAVPLDIKSMMFTTTNITYPGNPNNRLDPGETSQLVVSLENRGELNGTAIVGILSSPDTSVMITDNTADFGNISIGGSGSNTLSPFVVQVRTQVYRGHNVNFNLQLTSSNGSVASRVFSAVIGNVESFDPVGPDNYGYYIYDNTDGLYSPSPTYSWQEISPSLGGFGTRIAFPHNTDDDAVVINNLPFNFVYYGHSFNYMMVSINGFVAFDTTRYDQGGDHWSNFDNNEIPESGAPSGLIAPFWDDLKYDASGTNGVYKYSDVANHRYILEWNACYHPQAPGNHPETFEMIIFDPAYYPTPTGDAEIVFQYRIVYNDDTDDWDWQAPGLYCTVGMQNLTNDDGLQYTYDNLYHPAAAVLQAGRAIKITTAAGLQQPPDIDYHPTSMTISAPPGQIALDTLTISNVSGGPLSFVLNEYTDNGILATGKPRKQIINRAASIPIGYTRAEMSKDRQIEPIYPPSILNHGGPDIFGNVWKDSDDPDGPTYGWIDISGVGTLLPFVGDDDNLGPFDMGMNFPFYNDTVSSLYITCNGILSFATGTTAWENVGIPNSDQPNNYIPILWDDLSPQNGGSAYYYHDVANNRFIVSFTNVPFYSGGGNVNFEAVLYPNGKILLQYASLDGGTRGLNQCTVGIENADGSDGLQIVYNSDYLHSNLAILISPPSRWLSSNVLGGSLVAGHDTTAIITFNATYLTSGTYTGHIDLDSNDPDEPYVQIPVTFYVSDIPPLCPYTPGDINGNGSVNGVDIVFAVNYFKGTGLHPPTDCSGICPEVSPFYAAGDVNGNCAFNGIDITFFVRFLKLQVPALLNCPDCQPGSLNLQLPGVMPKMKAKTDMTE